MVYHGSKKWVGGRGRLLVGRWLLLWSSGIVAVSHSLSAISPDKGSSGEKDMKGLPQNGACTAGSPPDICIFSGP